MLIFLVTSQTVISNYGVYTSDRQIVSASLTWPFTLETKRTQDLSAESEASLPAVSPSWGDSHIVYVGLKSGDKPWKG